MDSKRLSRREFVQAAAVASATALGAVRPGAASEEGARPRSPAAVPQVKLGRTGVTVPVLGMGTATAGLFATPREAASLYDEAIDRGVSYLDTAPEFAGYGHAQTSLGKVLAKRRERVFLVTKCWKPGGKEARELLERNLDELRTDHADLVYAHSVGSDPMDPETVMGKGGVLEMLLAARKEGLTRFVGISGHNRPERFLRILERFEIDVMMCAVNFADRHTYDFENRVFPEAARRGVGLVAMKIFGGHRGARGQSMIPPADQDLGFRYALSVPGVAVAVVGMRTSGELEENVRRVQAFRPLSEAERAALEAKGKALAAEWGAHFGPVS